MTSTAKIAYSDLPDFTQGYIEALFFCNSASGVSSDEWWERENQEALTAGTNDGCLPDDVGFDDLSKDALNRIVRDICNFSNQAHDLIAKACTGVGYDLRQAGRDFFYTRCGHGVGFWDRNLGEVGDQLSKLASGFGDVFPSYNRDANGECVDLD